ncbi:MAG: hypothetical protein WCC35_16030, partial [Bradyrhizobium sp.]
MRARDLAGFDDEPGAADGDATETELAACICFGLWRRYAILNTSARPQGAVRFPPDRDHVVG